MFYNEDTITASATNPGTGAISVVRISGKESFGIVDKIFDGKLKISNALSHTIHYGKIIDSGNVIDDVLVALFRSPNSYTGEDSCEISSHGSAYIVKKIIELLVDQGARLAEPGEFTKRAFLNGKIDLAQAEAVADVISSSTEASLKGARNQLDGVLSAKVGELRKGLISVLSLLELELDFVEEEIEFVPLKEVKKKINQFVREIEKLMNTFHYGKVIRDGVNVVIAGKPNVGKSSILNFLLKESRAIVSKTPGTTRDVIREDIDIDGYLFRLFDTAGIRFTSDDVEREGVERSRDKVKNADVILFINDSTYGYDNEVYEEIKKLNTSANIITIFNKCDLKSINSMKSEINVSAKTGEGMERLLELMKARVDDEKIYTEKSAVVTNIRHYDALKKAKEKLHNAIIAIDEKLSGEFVSVDLRQGTDYLGEIIGEVTSDDILNNIFSKFCIGK